MSNKVAFLKHATPKMKYQHMNYVLEWRADLKEHQANFTGDVAPKCTCCGGEVEKAPMKKNTCYDCYRNSFN